ncbi:MAG: DNA ligase D [Acidobacteriota bacterium]
MSSSRAKRPLAASAGQPERLLQRLFPPMLATLVEGVPPNEGDYVFELKYDGFRAVSAIVDGSVAVWSRNQLDLSGRFPFVAEAVGKLKVDEAVLDGEIVALDSTGASRFELLQRGEMENSVYFVFDLLWLNGTDLRRRKVEERRQLLEKLLTRPPKGIRLSEQFTGSARQMMEAVSLAGHEGLIAKRRGSLYEAKRSKAWLKMKAHHEQEVAVVGFTLSSNDEKQIGALLAGVMQNGAMHYAGKVGTGYSAKQRVDLKRVLASDAVERTAIADAPRMKQATWVRPRLVAQVRFTEWTSEGKLRHPSFLGLRPDKSPEECIREMPAQIEKTKKLKQASGTKTSSPAPRSTKERPAKTAAATGSARTVKSKSIPEIVLTSPERILYPRDGITKQDVAGYYEAVSLPMIEALSGRPLALEHWNQGIDRPSWFHQDIGRDAQPWMTIVDTPTRTTSKTVSHLVVDRKETLRWLAQRSALTVHMWSSHTPTLEWPDWFVFDLDPAKGKGIEQAIEAALVMRRLLEQLELPSVPKTSGKRGIHILIPLRPGYSHEDAADFACRVSDSVAAKLDFMTTARPLNQRRGRLYLDCLQNGYGKTIVAPYSLRAIDGAPVSAPLEWSEVTKKLDPAKFNLRTMPDRLAKKGDLFRPALEQGVRLPKLR